MLPLWRHAADGRVFEIRLQMACRPNVEDDLTLIALADGSCLHRLSFSWVDGGFVGAGSSALPILPFAARNQGYREDGSDALAAFEQAFPHNSPSFFCFAALAGIAQALDMDRILGVKAACQSAYDPAASRHFANAYDHFWQTLGGINMPGPAYEIALPLRLRPLCETPAKHRKRAATRRGHWAAVAESARRALLPHVVPSRGRGSRARAAGAGADAVAGGQVTCAARNYGVFD